MALLSALLVILGAGASFDWRLDRGPNVVIDSPAGRIPTRIPPLTDQLFDSVVDDVQRLFPGVDQLRATIAARVSQGQPLERVLADLSEETHDDAQARVREVAPYLRELIGNATSERRPTTYDSLLTAIQGHELTAFFLTLNYDLLLEEAIGRTYRRTGKIASLSDYVQQGLEWQVVKLHGSVNWVRRTSGPSVDTGGFIGSSRSEDMPRYLAAISNARIEDEIILKGFLPENDPLGLWDDTYRPLYPAMAMPSDRKYGFVCPTHHVSSLRDFMLGDPAVLIVGTKGLDADLMELLASSRRDNSVRLTLVVNPAEASAIAGRFAEVLGRRVGSVDVGFKDFVHSERFEDFLNIVKAA